MFCLNMQQLRNSLEKYTSVKIKLRNINLTRKLPEEGIDQFCSCWQLPFITSERKDMYAQVLIPSLSPYSTQHISSRVCKDRLGSGACPNTRWRSQHPVCEDSSLGKRCGSPGGCCANKHILTQNTSVLSQNFGCRPRGVAVFPFCAVIRVQSDNWDLSSHSPRGHNLFSTSVEEHLCSRTLKFTKDGQLLTSVFAFSSNYH